MRSVAALGTEKIDPILGSEMNVPLFQDWMSKNVAGFEPAAFEIRRLTGGESNLTMLIEQGARRWVLRRPPMGPYPPSGHDMGREFLFYRSLQDTAVPVPQTHGLCTDEAVLGAPFYVMDHVPGRVIATTADAETLGHADRHRLCEALARTLAAIHTIDIDGAGLGSVARRGDYVQRQVKRWTSQWESFDPGENPSIAEISRRLGAAIPKNSQTTVVHGDFRIGNMMVAPEDSSRIIAVLDWEMATLGDPLADLGYSLIFWGSANPYIEPSVTIPDLPGFMTEAELITAYEQAGGIMAGSIDYYKVLAWFKLAVMCQSYIGRFRAKGADPAPMIRHRDAMAAMALDTANRSRIAGLNGR